MEDTDFQCCIEESAFHSMPSPAVILIIDDVICMLMIVLNKPKMQVIAAK